MPYSIYGFIFSSRALVGRRIQKKWHVMYGHKENKGGPWSYVTEFQESKSICDHDSVFKFFQYVDFLQWLGCLVGPVLSFTSAAGSYEIKQFVMWQKGKYPVTALECTPVSSRSQKDEEGCRKDLPTDKPSSSKCYQQRSKPHGRGSSRGRSWCSSRPGSICSCCSCRSHDCSHHNFHNHRCQRGLGRRGRSDAWLS